MKARLILNDGTRFEGLSLGAMGTGMGEVVFNTAIDHPRIQPGGQSLAGDPFPG